MATYNIIKNGFFTSNTSSGTGNVDLTITDLNSLVDNVTSSGISLIQTDSLYLDVDLQIRMKVGGIFIYSNDLTKVDNIDFLYKNYIEDDYTLCTKTVTAVYNGHIPEPSAPQYVRCIISGVDIDIYEFSIVNDDHIIGFGQDGLDNETWIDNTPIGTLGIPQEVVIYNNSEPSTATVNASAYVCVDYTGAGKDDFIKIAKNEEGPYLGYEHGAIAGYEWKDWDSGTYDNIYNEIADNSLRILDIGDYFYLQIGYVSTLPITTAYYRNNTFGMNHAWDYDHVNQKIYCGFWTGGTTTSSVIRLWEYDLITNTWTTRGDLATGNLHTTWLCLCCDSDNVYFLGGGNEVDIFLYKHSTTGELSNVTYITEVSYVYHNPSMVASNTGYVYIMSHTNTTGYCSRRVCKRITISDGTIWNISVGFSCHDHDYHHLLRYDYDQDYIYYIPFNGASYSVERYHVVGNYWEQDYFDFGNRIMNTYTDITFWVFDKKLFFSSPSYDKNIYIYDTFTDIVTTHTLYFKHSADTGWVWLIITEPIQELNTFSLYALSVLPNYSYLHGYNTGFENEFIEENLTRAMGSYTTNILSLDDPFKASYIIVDSKINIELNNISVKDNSFDNTIEVRSSTIPPTPIDWIFWFVQTTSVISSATKYVVGTDSFNKNWLDISTNSLPVITSTSVDRRTGRMFLGGSNNYNDYQYRIVNKDGVQLYAKSHSTDSTWMTFNKGVFFDIDKGFWAYVMNYTGLVHYAYNFGFLGSIYITDFYDFSTELNGTGAWYTETQSNTLIKLEYDCSIETAINLYNPRGVTGTEENGCWVVDIEDAVYGNCVKKYDAEGNLLRIITTGDIELFRIAHDHKSGFYALTSYALGEVWHYTSEGVKDMVVTDLFNEEYVRGGRRGVVLYSTLYKRIRYLDFATKTILWTKNYTEEIYNGNCSIPEIFSWDEHTEDIFADDYSRKLLPVDYDTTWYGDNNLEWKEVPKDGYFLPKCKYHQVRVTLRNFDGETSPIVKNIAIAPAIKIEDILPQQSKSVYVRSDIPAEEEVSLFNTRLKVWWDVEDDN